MQLFQQMETLKHRRPIFHSEADFQFALAWELQSAYPQAQVRLEVCPCGQPAMHVDILMWMDGRCYPIELKYKTLDLEYRDRGEDYWLKTHNAQDLGRYDCLKDLERMETLGQTMPAFGQGFTVVLSNDPSYWTVPSKDKPTRDSAFRIHEGLEKSGVCAWAGDANARTVQGREAPICLAGAYRVHWQPYSRLANRRHGVFRYALFEVDAPLQRPAPI
jgi:hypothetical protein